MITISLCMIVKNEEDVIERCLKSARDIADEIIVVDTGSNDSTKEICARFTNKIFDFKWNNNFSAARNYSFSKATKEYILWLDADDVILDEDMEKFKKLKYSLDKKVDVVMMKYNVGFDNKGNTTFSYYRERLLKRSLGFQWKEPVHEYLDINGDIVNSDISITHKKQHVVASDRNLLIYKKILYKGKVLSPRGTFYYARELYYNKKYDSAIKYFKRFLDSNKGWVEDNINACFNLSKCYDYKKDRKNMLKTLLKSFEYDNPRAEICCQLGYFYLEGKEYKKAIFWYKLATQIKKPEDSWGFVSHDYFGYLPNIQLAVCYDKMGNIEEAVKYNNMAGEFKPNDDAVNYNKSYFKKFLGKN